MTGGAFERPTPAVVVVDSRNVWGAATRHFGAGRAVLPDGVRAALRSYGFEAVEVHVAIGTTTTPNATVSERLRHALETNQRYAAAVNASSLGTTLHGRLVERKGELEEKLVDVLCAMQIARSAHDIVAGRSQARAIVVLSEDMDLIPAYQFAQDLQVPVYAAACATVDTRPDASWILLGEGSLRLLCERPLGRLVGRDLRQEMCRWLTAPTPYRMQFRVIAWEKGKNRLRLRHNSGALGIWDAPPSNTSTDREARHELEVVGLEPCGSDRDFPHLTLRPRSTAWPIPGLSIATVTRWKTPTRVEVRLPGGSSRALSAPIGSALPGDEVLVAEDPGRRQASWRLVGPLGTQQEVPGWSDSTVPSLARVTTGGTSPGARVRGMLAEGQEVTIQPPGSDTPRTGDLYAVVPIQKVGLPDGAFHVMTVAVSRALTAAG